jgi:hypothetical protein
MRELGFSRFCTAVLAAQMSPLDAIMSGPTGAWNAKFFGWPEPFPDGAPNEAARNEIEAHANQLHAVDFDVLTDDERAEFRVLAKGARDHANAKMSAGSGAALPTEENT